MSESFFYVPYKGAQFGSGYRFGVKLLIVGESFYDDVDHTQGPTWLIGKHVCEKPVAFLSTIERVIEGKPLKEVSRYRFWTRVAFTNFVQKSLRKDVGPTGSQLKGGRRPFADVLNDVRPDAVFLFSRKSWRYLPDTDEFPGSGNVPTRGLPESCPPRGTWSNEAYRYALSDNHTAIAGVFNHPRNLGHPAAEWHKRAETIIKLARKERLATGNAVPSGS